MVLCLSFNATAQLSTNELPVSFDMKTESLGKETQTVIMPKLDMAKIEAEDKEDEEYDVPPRFGYPHTVNYNLTNSGTWYELPNGDKLWQLNVVCPDALSVNFCFDKFWIPEGGKFFIYSKDKNYSIGAFTSRNNKGSREDIHGFATGLLYGSDVVLEYYQPKEVADGAVISIEYVVHGYRFIKIYDNKSFGDSGSCEVNINCSEGQDWQNEKRAVAIVVVNGTRWCTGSLLNNTDNNLTPFFLTANHCLVSGFDAAGNSNLNNYSFIWNYEEPGCVDSVTEPQYYSTSGATLLANSSDSDFALLRLSEDPKEIAGYTPYYLGWDCSGVAGTPGVCIHHPSGDTKKISTVYSTPIPMTAIVSDPFFIALCWKANWSSTENGYGITKPGSSGSSLINGNHKVIGQLTGGNANCDSQNSYSSFGRFDVSWPGNDTNSIYRRLNCWLDSVGTAQQIINGLLLVSTTTTLSAADLYYSDIRIINNGQLTVQDNIEIQNNRTIIIDSGGKLIIDGGKLTNVNIVQNAGSTLIIKNGGILGSTSSFCQVSINAGGNLVIDDGVLSNVNLMPNNNATLMLKNGCAIEYIDGNSYIIYTGNNHLAVNGNLENINLILDDSASFLVNDGYVMEYYSNSIAIVSNGNVAQLSLNPSNINLIINDGALLRVESNIVVTYDDYKSITVHTGGSIINKGKLLDVDLLIDTGASIHLQNGGRIKTINGFIAPLGAIVVIENGEIY
jgi:hypothetical protein